MQTEVERMAFYGDKTIVVRVVTHVHVNVNAWNDEYNDGDTASSIRYEIKQRVNEAATEHFRYLGEGVVSVEPTI